MSDKALWQIMVPCNFNDGKPVRTRHHKEWDRQIQNILSQKGMTIHTPGKGKWTNPKDGTTYVDRVIPVTLIASKDEMEKIAGITLKHYKQLAVLYFKISSETYIVNSE